MRNFFFLILTTSCLIQAQDFENKVLLEVQGKSIMADEFIHIYQKNLNVLSNEASDERLEDYLELFLHFHLKLTDARSKGIQDEDKFQNEFNKHYKQLADNYIANGEVTDEVIEETYQRLIKEVRVSHILVTVPQNASHSDWEKAHLEAKRIKQKIDTRNNSFEDIAIKFSQDPSVKENKGDMNWFKAFKMVLPFEDASYRLEVDEISEPVKTQFGYHIIKKTGERESVGKLKVAHIMLLNNSSKDSTKNKEQIFKIYEQLKSGDNFEDLAKLFSEDKNTADIGGELPPFEVGEINAKTFEEKAFALVDIGDYTEPFETQFGWHIVKKLGEIQVEDLTAIKEDLKRKIKTSNRVKLLNDRIKENIISHYDVTIDQQAIEFFTNLVDERIHKAKWKMDKEDVDLSATILKIDELEYKYSDFSNYIEKNQIGFTGKRPIEVIIEEMFSKFTYSKLVEYHKPNLTNLDRDFELNVNEYKHGLLIFELMEREIWDTAKTDTTGLESYYNAHIEKYVSPEKINGTAYTFENKKQAKKFLKQVSKKGKNPEEALSNSKKGMEKELNEVPLNELNIEAINSLDLGYQNYYKDSNKYVVLHVEELLPRTTKKFEEVRGQVISDYQNLLEKQWIEDLKAKYSFKINQETFELLKQKFE